jgi:hypothetical protein
MKKLFKFLAIIVLTSSVLFAVGVEPMSIEIEANAGSTAEFDLTIRGEAQDVITKITPFQPLQKETGDITYQLVDAEDYSPIGWLDMEDFEVNVPAGGKVDVPVKVNIPFGVRGTYILTLMVEPESAQGQGMIQFKIRYAVRVTIRINSSGIRENAKLEIIEFVPDENQSPNVQVRMNNTSGLDYICSVNASIRDEKGRLIENIPLMTESEQKRGQQGIRFYPDATLIFSGIPEKVTKVGNYRIQAVVKMNDFQRIFQENIDLSGDNFKFPDPKNYYMIIDPTERLLSLKPGSVKTEVIEAKNEGPEAVDVTIQFADVKDNFSQSIKPFVSFRGTPEFTLEPGRSNRLVSMFKIPREATENTYYGKLTYSATKEGSPVTDERVILAVQVGEKKPSSATLTNVSSSGEVVSALFKNDSEVHLGDLMGEVTILKESGELVSTTEINPVNEKWIFPEDDFTLLGQSETELPTGTILYRVKLYEDKNLLLETEVEGYVE